MLSGYLSEINPTYLLNYQLHNYQSQLRLATHIALLVLAENSRWMPLNMVFIMNFIKMFSHTFAVYGFCYRNIVMNFSVHVYIYIYEMWLFSLVVTSRNNNVNCWILVLFVYLLLPARYRHRFWHQ